MNTPAYRKAYMENLNREVSNNNKNSTANKTNPAYNQYVAATGTTIPGMTTFTNNKSKSTKK